MVHSTDKHHINGNVEEATITSAIAAEDQAQFEGSSDGEGEKTARERLKKTSLAGLTQQSSETLPSGEMHPLSQSTIMEPEQNEGGNSSRGRPAKKRSFEDLTRGESIPADAEMSEQPLPKSGHHKRMRSRDVASGEHVVGKFEADAANSVREESDLEAQQSPGGPGILVDAPSKERSKLHEVEESENATSDQNGQSAGSETKSGPALTGDTKVSAVKATSAFTNTSTASPFGAISAAKQQSSSISSSPESKDTPTSPSAFASSGLSAFAASEKSPFGSSSNKSSGGFGSATSKGTFGSASSGGFGGTTTGFLAKQPPSTLGGGTGFGGSAGFGSSSGFGNSSGFGSSTGFGAPKPFGTGISSFAGSGGGAGSFGTGKPIGAARQENEDGSENSGDDENEQTQDKEAKHDDRFHEQDVATGEEKENTIFVCRAKLYTFEREWKERGVGTFKINVRYVDTSLSAKDKEEEDQDSATSTDGEEDKPHSKDRDFSGDDLEGGADDSFATTERRARLLMRTDGVHRVILNTPVFKDMHIGEQDGSEPSGKTMHLTGLEDGKLRPFKIKIGKEEVLKDLYWKVVDLRTDLA